MRNMFFVMGFLASSASLADGAETRTAGTLVTIEGSGFVPGMQVNVFLWKPSKGRDVLSTLPARTVDETHIDFVLPLSASPGIQDVEVLWPDGSAEIRPSVLTIEMPKGGDSVRFEPRSWGVRNVLEASRFRINEEALRLLTSSHASTFLLGTAHEPGPYRECQVLHALGDRLLALEMLNSAQLYYLESVKSCPGQPFFYADLEKAVEIAAKYGDEEDLVPVLQKVDAPSNESPLADLVRFTKGMTFTEGQDQTRSLAYLREVYDRPPYWERASYAIGVILHSEGKDSSALKIFDKLASGKSMDVDREKGVPVSELAVLASARVLFERKEYARALSRYSEISRSSELYSRALLEAAWSEYHLGNDEGARSRIDEVRRSEDRIYTSHGISALEIPEAEVLRSIIQYRNHEDEGCRRTLTELDARFGSLLTDLRDLLVIYSVRPNNAPTDQAWEFFSKTGSSPIVGAVRPIVGRDRELVALRRRIEFLEREQALLRRQPEEWRASIGKHLEVRLAEEKLRLKRRAGERLLDRLTAIEARLGDLVEQGRIILLELSARQAEERDQRGM